MELVLKLQGDVREKAGTDTIKMPITENETVDTLLIRLSKRYPLVTEAILDPTTGELRSDFNILLNGRRIQQLRGIHTKLKDRDEISILPPEQVGNR